jgi:hypothetical protein
VHRKNYKSNGIEVVLARALHSSIFRVRSGHVESSSQHYVFVKLARLRLPHPIYLTSNSSIHPRQHPLHSYLCNENSNLLHRNREERSRFPDSTSKSSSSLIPTIYRHLPAHHLDKPSKDEMFGIQRHHSPPFSSVSRKITVKEKEKL